MKKPRMKLVGSRKNLGPMLLAEKSAIGLRAQKLLRRQSSHPHMVVPRVLTGLADGGSDEV
jgi:hypothetical protein